MSGSTEDATGVVIVLSRRRRARGPGRRDLWLAALVLGALVALLLVLARPFDARARGEGEPLPALLGG
jgi:hypothetical protein